MEEFRGRRKAVKDLSALLAKPQRSPAPEVSMLAATCSLQQGDASTSPWVAACLGLAWKQPAGARHLLGTRDPMHHHPTRPPSLSGSRPKHQERDEAAQHCHGHAAPAQKGTEGSCSATSTMRGHGRGPGQGWATIRKEVLQKADELRGVECFKSPQQDQW